jgi:hypothetical protein
MSLRFVKTSILSSEDGLDFSKEQSVETEEQRLNRLKREQSKPLYEQLAEQQQKKQEEYDANTRLLFAPPKSIDEEEFRFLESLEDMKKAEGNKRIEEEKLTMEILRSVKKKESTR